MIKARGVEVARGGPGPARRVVQLRARQTSPIITPCNEHLAVGQQGRRLQLAPGVEAARGSPGPARWIVQFRARQSCICTPCDEHLAVGQQRRRVLITCGVEAARGTPCSARWIVQFRARQSAAVIALLRREPGRWAATSPCVQSARC